jgi:hypothetical protein
MATDQIETVVAGNGELPARGASIALFTAKNKKVTL